MSAPPWLELDRTSLLVNVAGAVSFAALERALGEEGLTLDVAAPAGAAGAAGQVAHTPELTVAGWLETGALGARSAWLDPADHLLAGFSARIRASGETFVIAPAPRRAVGPDLTSLLSGMRGRWLVLESVWLRVHRNDVLRPATTSFAGDDGAAIDPAEAALFDAIDAALR